MATLQQTLSIPELLDLILGYLDVRTLLLAQRVSRHGRGLNPKSSSLQQNLFFAPSNASSVNGLGIKCAWNPLLEDLFPLFSVGNLKGAKFDKNQLGIMSSSGGDPFHSWNQYQRRRLLNRGTAVSMRTSVKGLPGGAC
ncbi:hypothetical protein BJ170DRAFT_220463 [Xylariales sp. AK1849]|nr:hypothetical protein BJ170DRAFT_220463 [Xylariales sp. AK1849]